MQWEDKVIERTEDRSLKDIVRYTSAETVSLLKVIHCLSIDDFYEMMECDQNDDPGNYINNKFLDMKDDMILWLCELDSDNLHNVFDYAAKRQILYALKRSKT